MRDLFIGILYTFLIVIISTLLIFGLIRTFSGTGNGVFQGKLIGVSWEGRFYKSCEIEQQVGSNRDSSSSYDKALCILLERQIGQEVKISYERVKPTIKLDTPFIIKSFEVIK